MGIGFVLCSSYHVECTFCSSTLHIPSFLATITGTCACFEGQYGTDCALQVQVAARFQSDEGIYSTQPLQAGELSSGTEGDTFAQSFGEFL